MSFKGTDGEVDCLETVNFELIMLDQATLDQELANLFPLITLKYRNLQRIYFSY